MKNYLLFLFLFVSLCVSAQTEIFLSDPIFVTNVDGLGNRSPRVVTLADGRPVVYWGKSGSNSKMYIAVGTETGFEAPVEVPIGSVEIDIWASGLGPQLAARGNSIFLVFEAYGQGIYVVRSTDGGASFELPVSVFDAPAGRVATLPGITVDANGNPIVSFVTTNFQEQEALYEVAVSLDGGASFEPTVVANTEASGGVVCECCPASLTIANNEQLILTFRNNDDNIRDIWASVSSLNELNFNAAADIDDTDWFLSGCPSNGPDAIVSGDSLVSVAFSGIESGPGIYLSTLHLPTMQKGYQFKFPTFEGNAVVQNFPRIAGQADTIGVVYHENANIGTDVVLAWSVNGTNGLQNQLVKIADENLSQNYADIAFSHGLFHIVYQDQLSGKVQYRRAGFSPMTAVEQPQTSSIKIDIQPNPFSDEAVIDISAFEGTSFEISIFNQQGQQVKTIRHRGQQYILKKENFAEGVYFIKVSDGKSLGWKRVVIL